MTTATTRMGWAYIAAGGLALLYGISLAPSGVFGFGPAQHAGVAIVGLCGATLLTMGARRLTAWSVSRLTAWGLTAFALVYAATLAAPPLTIIFGLLSPTVFIAAALEAGLRPLHPWMRVTMPMLAAAAFFLAAFKEQPAAKDGSAQTRQVPTLVRYIALALFGSTAWSLAPLYVIALARPGHPGDLLDTMITSPIGLVGGLLVGLWSEGPAVAQRQAVRYGLGTLLLWVLPPVILLVAMPAMRHLPHP